MIIDNCPAHPHSESLKAMTVAFLPKCTTFITQPMDQGVIIIALGNNKVIPKFSILTTFVNCFKKAKISATSQIEAINDSNAHLVISNINLMSSQEKDSSLLQGDSAESFVNFDNDVQSSNGVILKKRY